MEDYKNVTRINNAWHALICALAFALVVTACAPRRSLPLNGPLSLTSHEIAGEKVFMQHCQRCHPQGEGGLGPAINPAPALGKRLQTRHGFGVMPAFKDDQISDNELDQLISYLKALKKHS
jgi:mono/diheme cytochrome c family protein